MSAAQRRLLLAFLTLALFGYAFSPAVQMGLCADDFAHLAAAKEAREALAEAPFDPRELYQVRPPLDRPLTTLSLALSDRLWRRGSWAGAKATPLRLENLLLLALGALAVGSLVRRAVRPWTGLDHARAAGLASTVVLALHPLCLSMVGRLVGRGELIALVLGATAAVLFLRARQRERTAELYPAALLGCGASMGSALAWFLPPLVFFLEYLSSKRHRPAYVRMRTASTAFAIAFLCASADNFLRFVLDLPMRPPPAVTTLEQLFSTNGFVRAFTYFFEKLGLLVFPVNANVRGLVGLSIAGVLWLAAMQPALVAMRAAPRLWGWLGAGWVLSLLAAQFGTALVRVTPEDLTFGGTLFASTVVMAVGLGLASTALSGPRRPWLPASLALGYALLSHADARPWRTAARDLAQLRVQLVQAREEHGEERRFLVLDPPGRTAGLDIVRPALPWLLHPLFAGDASAGPSSVRGISSEGFSALVREPEFREMRRRGIVLVRDVESVMLPFPEYPGDDPGELDVAWSASPASPELLLDPLLVAALRVVVRPGTPTMERPLVTWTAVQGDGDGEPSLAGVWIEGAGGPVAWFDLGGSVSWLAAGRVTRAALAAGGKPLDVVAAEFLPELPRFHGELLPLFDERGSWFFEPVPGDLPVPLFVDEEELAWRLRIFEPRGFAVADFEVLDRDGRLTVIAGAERLAEDLRAAGKDVVWSLSYLAADTRLMRTRKRRPAVR